MGIVLAIIIFDVIILIHELGHFIAAKANGVKVNEFALGMGPKLLKFKKGDTLYALRLFPIGGFCAMEGEDESSSDDGAFCNKAVWRKVIIVIAGVVMNFVLGIVILIIATATSGSITSRKISYFEDGAASHKTGLNIDDEIIEINGMHIFTATDISYQLSNDSDGIFNMTVLRNGEKVKLENVQLISNDKSTHIDFKVYPKKITFTSTIGEALKTSVSDARIVYVSLIDMVKGKYSLKDLSGPVGIVDSIDTVVDNQKDKDTGKINWSSLAETMLSFSAIITINIGIFNLLPFPALDGGRLLFLIIEAIRKKPVKKEVEGMIHAIGLILLFVLMIVVTVSDIIKIF